MNWDAWFKITNILQDESWHFGLSAISGFVVFLLTQDIQCYLGQECKNFSLGLTVML